MKTDREARIESLLSNDRPYWARGLCIAGIDEAGRGPLCGNVVAACVIMPKTSKILWVDDSKKLSEKRRENVFDEIMAEAVYVGVGEVSPEIIDEINILEATKRAMSEAADGANADLYLIDAVKNIGLKGIEMPIIHGDAISYSIAAASIIAKVTRDRQMAKLHMEYPQYGFLKNKGYGTKEHIEALKKYGPCPEHRKTFIGHFIDI